MCTLRVGEVERRAAGRFPSVAVCKVIRANRLRLRALQRIHCSAYRHRRWRRRRVYLFKQLSPANVLSRVCIMCRRACRIEWHGPGLTQRGECS